jgi:hypothetical protein
MQPPPLTRGAVRVLSRFYDRAMEIRDLRYFVAVAEIGTSYAGVR